MTRKCRALFLMVALLDLRCWAAQTPVISSDQDAIGAQTPASESDKPLWEFGLGAGVLTLPDYRGSDHIFVYGLPVPYFVYRGKFLKADRNGLRGSFFDSDRVEVSLDTNASLPVKSENDEARSGMPDLRPTVEVGPSVNLKLWSTTAQDVRLDLRLPVRTALTVESSPHDVGWIFSPRLNLDIRKVRGLPGWNVGFLVGPLISSRRYDSYYYSVAEPFARPDRAAYQAPGGYGGTQFVVALSKRYTSWWLGAFMRADTLSHASFVDSPLVRSRHYLAAGIALVRVFEASSRLVPASDDQ